MQRYQLLPLGVLDRDLGRQIRPRERGWPEYLAWRMLGNTPDPADPPPGRWPTLETARAEVRAAINLERNRREAAGFPYLGKTIDSDPRSAQRIGLAVQAAQALGPAFSIVWTTADNSLLTLDAAGVLAMPVALAQHAIALHEAAKSLKAWADTADLAALEAFDPATTEGWP